MHTAIMHWRPSTAGDMDLNPDAGEYRFQATVPEVEVNALRETLGVRPMPFPLAGALRGTLFCTGPLEEPSFSGAASRPSVAGQGVNCVGEHVCVAGLRCPWRFAADLQ